MLQIRGWFFTTSDLSHLSFNVAFLLLFLAKDMLMVEKNCQTSWQGLTNTANFSVATPIIFPTLYKMTRSLQDQEIPGFSAKANDFEIYCEMYTKNFRTRKDFKLKF